MRACFSSERLTLGQSKDQVLAYGIGNYNEECRKIVMRYAKEWESTVTRLGRWIDFENDYKTLNVSYASLATTLADTA